MAERVDGSGAAYAGSQLQTQIYVNRRVADLDDSIHAEFPEISAAAIDWRSPLAADLYVEHWDAAFLECLDLGAHAADLAAFWPRGGPHWDALAIVDLAGSDRPAVLLAEGKSYPGEMYASGCKAKPGSRSRELIEKSLGATQRLLGVTERTPEDWCGPLYQSANRLAHVYWLRSLGVRAWLVHLLFVDDPRSPTTADEWEAALEKANAELGLEDIRTEAAGHVLLRAGARPDIEADG